MTAAPLRLLADENVPLAVVTALRADGVDVEWIVEADPGANDGSILQMAVSTQRVLLTIDKDFGDLVFNQGQPLAAGVILLRGRPQRLIGVLRELLVSGRPLDGHFTVVEPFRIRTTPVTRR